MKNKKIVKTIVILLIVSICIEIGLICYNIIMRKVFNKIHLIGNETINIKKEDTEITTEDGITYIKVCNVDYKMYNLGLKTKNPNNDVYMRVIMNNDEKFIPKENKDATKFKTYYFGGTESYDKTFKIAFLGSELNLENVDSIVINDNLDYLPKIQFSFVHFIIIFGISLAVYGLILLFKIIKEKEIKIKKEYIFLCLASVFGVTLVFVSAPQPRYDEHAHFWRAYEISEGNVVSQITNELPKSMTELFSKENGSYPNYDINYKDIQKNLSKRLDKDEKVKFAVGATASLTPVSYMPQLIGMFIGKIFNSSPIIILWLRKINKLNSIYYFGIFCN